MEQISEASTNASMMGYPLDEMFFVPELRQTAEELSELARRRSDLLTGRSRVAEAPLE
jgi:hypothetical protein